MLGKQCKASLIFVAFIRGHSNWCWNMAGQYYCRVVYKGTHIDFVY